MTSSSCKMGLKEWVVQRAWVLPLVVAMGLWGWVVFRLMDEWVRW